MTKARIVRTASLAALVVVTSLGHPTPVTAADPAVRPVMPAAQIYGDKAAQFLPLGVSKSVVVDLPSLVGDEQLLVKAIVDVGPAPGSGLKS